MVEFVVLSISSDHGIPEVDACAGTSIEHIACSVKVVVKLIESDDSSCVEGVAREMELDDHCM